jgi:hypothetical protein
MKSLYELTEEAIKIEQIILEAHGEITPEIEKLLDEVDIKTPEKIDSYVYVIERMKNSAEFIKQKVEQHKKLIASYKRVENDLRDRLKSHMLTLGKTDAFGCEYRLKLSKGKSKLILDQASLSLKYLKEEIIFTPNKQMITDALEADKAVDGAYLEDVFTLRKYINKEK